MSESALIDNFPAKPTHPSAERIGILREKVKSKIPAAEKIIKKSGLSPRENLKRLVINTAGEKVRDEIQARKESSIDELTGLLTSKAFAETFVEKVAASSRTNSDLAIIYLDANNLKSINDTQGHAAGDEYLKSIAEVLKSGTRINDAAARWGGDEYGVILANANIEGAKEWWKQMVPLFKEKGISIGAGASMIHPEDLQNPTQYAKVMAQAKEQADKALYVAKPISKSTNDCIMITSADLTQDAEIELPKAA
jgi:diguanylate cyclase (GGDEF)-like protein